MLCWLSPLPPLTAPPLTLAALGYNAGSAAPEALPQAVFFFFPPLESPGHEAAS